MILKTIGFYAIIIGIISNMVLLYLLFSQNRPLLFLLIDIAILGVIISIFSFIFDKRKIMSLISLILCLLPILIIYIIQKK